MSDRNTIARRLRLLSFAAAILLMMCGKNVYAQTETAPTNDLPNPYTSSTPWGTLPAGRTWGALNGMAIDNDGASVWAVSRCRANPAVPLGESPLLYGSCAGSSVPPVMKFDAPGKLLTAFGAGMFIFPHKIYIDRDNNVWVIDGRGVNQRERKAHPADAGKGHTVVKFSPEGRVLLTIGRAGVAGHPPEALTQPNSIVIAPNGDIFIAEGHGGQTPGAPPDTVSRISKFTTDGVFITEWKQFSRPSGIAIRDGMIYVADSESNGVAPRPGWKRGIRIGRISDDAVLCRIPDPLELKGTSGAEGVAVDAKGNVYGGEVGPRQLVRYAKP